MTMTMAQPNHRNLLRLARLAVLPLLVAATLAACGDRSTDIPAAADQPSPTKLTGADLINRGRYLVRAADCAACHTAKDGAPFAGGVPLASPFGTFYGTNITPDKEHGIGKWSADEFYKALHDGVTPD